MDSVKIIKFCTIVENLLMKLKYCNEYNFCQKLLEIKNSPKIGEWCFIPEAYCLWCFSVLQWLRKAPVRKQMHKILFHWEE